MLYFNINFRWAMQQKLPLKDFKWVEEPETFNIEERMYDISKKNIWLLPRGGPGVPPTPARCP